MNLLAHRVKDVAVPVVAAGRPTTDMDAGTADGLLPCVADFDAASAWGDGDEVTTEIPDGAGFDPTSLGSAWGDGNGNDAPRRGSSPLTPPGPTSMSALPVVYFLMLPTSIRPRPGVVVVSSGSSQGRHCTVSVLH